MRREARGAWHNGWAMRWRPREWSPRTRLAVAAACSLLLHLCLLSGVILAKRFVPRIVVKKGEPIVVELQNPEEFAPRGNPARPLSPFPPTQPEAPKAQAPPRPKAEVRPAPPAPKPVLPAPKAPPATPEQAVAKAQPAEPEGLKPLPPAPPKAAPQPEPAAPPREEAGSEGGAERQAAIPPGTQREPGGGGLRGGRGGIEGEPIPLDTKDPRYTDYFDKIRRRIRANWIYPREAGERGIGGQLLIEFVIAKDGHLAAIDLRHSSGVEILDRFALNAVKLAQPFPPVPDSVAKVALPIAGIFTYQIVDSGLMNNFLR